MAYSLSQLRLNPLLPPLLLLLAAVGSQPASASQGDQSYVYHNCMLICRAHNCSGSGSWESDSRRPPPPHPLARWSLDTCEDRCRHGCIWEAVAAFERDGLPTPKFHGRWPFARLLGVQEPASAVFSALNCACHVYMLLAFREQVGPQAPMYQVWHLYSVVAIVTWLSSTVFHVKDVPLTEQLDYFSALLYLLTCLFCLACRLTCESQQQQQQQEAARRRWPVLACLALALLAFYSHHVWYLSSVTFDYGYNMAVNLAVGAVNCVGWLAWSLVRLRAQPYTRNCLLVVGLLNGLVLLEVLDFPPICWVFDAHSLWHGGTVLLAVPWYRFAIADCQYLAAGPQRAKSA